MTDAKRRDRAFYSKLNAKNLQNHERLNARSAVMYNTSLSAQARILYFLIDDKGGAGDGMWWGWRKMALRLGLSRAYFFQCLAQLKEAGAVTIERRGRRMVYLTKQVHQGGPIESERSTIAEQQVHQGGLSDDPSFNESVLDESGASAPRQFPARCKTCHDTGFLPGWNSRECGYCDIAAKRHAAEVAAWKRGERAAYPVRL